MGGGIDKQQQTHMKNFYAQAGTLPAHQQQMQKATGMANLTGGKTKESKDSKDNNKGSAGGAEGGVGGAEDGADANVAMFGGMVKGFLKSGQKEKKEGVERRLTSEEEQEVAEESETSETEAAKESSSIEKAKMEKLQKPSAEAKVTRASPGVRSGDIEYNSISEFIDNWLKMKRSPGHSLELGEIMVEEGRDNKVEPFILLAIAANASEYGKKDAGLDGLMGVGKKDEGPEEQIMQAAMRFNMLREDGEAAPDDAVTKQMAAVNRAGWSKDRDWNKLLFRRYQEIKRAWERYQEA